MKSPFVQQERDRLLTKFNSDYYASQDIINQEKLANLRNLVMQDKFSIEEFASICQVLEFMAFVPKYDSEIEKLEKKASERLNKLTGKSHDEIIKK
jgi:hypothetical protein